MHRDDLLWFDVFSYNDAAFFIDEEPVRNECDVDPFFVEIQGLKVFDRCVGVADVK